jgi:hypothetical protein
MACPINITYFVSSAGRNKITKEPFSEMIELT